MVDARTHALVECVPNFSEGRHLEVIEELEAAVKSVSGTVLLDRHVDASHNRTVLTFVGEPGPVAEAAFRVVKRAGDLIDMEQHQGVHPRMGAADVVPFVPLGDTPMELCVEIANRLGRRLGSELGLPVYLYGEAALRPERKRLPDVRRGEYEGIRDSIASDPSRIPDFGPALVGPAGATAVGARTFLVAYNVTLGTGDLTVAKQVARAIRESSGGLTGVQARGFTTADPGVVQVSVNVLDTRRTPLHVVFERISDEAAARGVDVLTSELVGLLPTAVMAETTRHYLRFPSLHATQAIEARIAQVALARLPG